MAAALLAGALAAPRVSADPTATWMAHLQASEGALMRGDLADAVQEWHHGFTAALRGRTWVGLLGVGDAYVRLAESGALPGSAKPVARSLYLEALVQARAHGSADGVLRVAAAFERLGDRGVAAQCLMAAESVARGQRDATALRDVSRARDRLGLPPSAPSRGRAVGALLDRGWAAFRTSWIAGGR